MAAKIDSSYSKNVKPMVAKLDKKKLQEGIGKPLPYTIPDNINNGASFGNTGKPQPYPQTIDTSYLKNINGLGQPVQQAAAQVQPVSYAANVPQVGAQQTVAPANVAGGGQAAAPAAESTPVDSYEQWLQNNAKTYEESFKKKTEAIDANAAALQQQAESQRQQAEANAEVERQRAIVDAQSSYAQNVANYGSKAEAMQNMGLAGSGYSDYLNAQAYAQQRGETQGANAQATTVKRDAEYAEQQAKLSAEQQANADKLNAQLSYEQNLSENEGTLAEYQQKKEETRKAAYAELLGYANDGTYSKEQLEQLAKNYNLSTEDIASLTSASDTYAQNKAAEEEKAKQQIYTENYGKAIDNINVHGSGLEADYLDNLLKMDYITKDQYDDLKDKYNYKVVTSNNDTFNTAIKNGDEAVIDSALANADKYYAEGKMTKDDYQGMYAKQAESATSDVDSSASDTDIAKANTELDELYSSGKITEEVYKKCVFNLNKSRFYVQGLGSGRNNDDIDITIGSNSRKGNGKSEYDLLCGDEVTNGGTKSTLNRLASSNGKTDVTPSNGTIVVYGNKMYIYTKKGWRNVKSDNNNGDVEKAIKAYKEMTKQQ